MKTVIKVESIKVGENSPSEITFENGCWINGKEYIRIYPDNGADAYIEEEKFIRMVKMFSLTIPQ